MLTLKVDELDDAVWFPLVGGLARHGVAVDRTNHKVLDVSHFWLIVDLVDKA